MDTTSEIRFASRDFIREELRVTNMMAEMIPMMQIAIKSSINVYPLDVEIFFFIS